MPRAAVNGINLYYKVHGKGEPLVLIAGIGADHRSWFSQIGPFGKYYTVITFDTRGIGRSDRPAGLYSLKTLADDVVGLMDSLDMQKANILGESFGSLAAQEIAIAFPERVGKLVLASGTVGAGVEHEVHPELMKAFGSGDSTTGVDMANVDIAKAMKAIISLSFNNWFYRTAMLFMSRFYMKPSEFKGMVEQLKVISTYSTLNRLHLIKSPTLVITGTKDKIVPPSMSDLLASGISGAKLVKIAGGSHSVRVEKKKRFNSEVLDFLASA